MNVAEKTAPAVAGGRRFWDVIDSVAATARSERREFFTFEEWAWIFRTAHYVGEHGEPIPGILLVALRRKRDAIEEAEALGKTAADLYRDECAGAQVARQIVTPIATATASRTRSRRRYRGESAAD